MTGGGHPANAYPLIHCTQTDLKTISSRRVVETPGLSRYFRASHRIVGAGELIGGARFTTINPGHCLPHVPAQTNVSTIRVVQLQAYSSQL